VKGKLVVYCDVQQIGWNVMMLGLLFLGWGGWVVSCVIRSRSCDFGHSSFPMYRTFFWWQLKDGLDLKMRSCCCICPKISSIPLKISLDGLSRSPELFWLHSNIHTTRSILHQASINPPSRNQQIKPININPPMTITTTRHNSIHSHPLMVTDTEQHVFVP
jgi:hypothetical protein